MRLKYLVFYVALKKDQNGFIINHTGIKSKGRLHKHFDELHNKLKEQGEYESLSVINYRLVGVEWYASKKK